MKPNENPRDLIFKTLSEKSCLKLDISNKTKDVFGQFKEALKAIADDLQSRISDVDDCIIVEYKDNGNFEAELRVADDILIFYQHTDVFDFDKSHPVWQTSYVNDDHTRSYCGMINVYNFLANSIHYSRENDIGYLIARIFINKDLHFFVEGKRQLGFLYNDFVNSKIDEQSIEAIIESAVLYCLDFDLLTPPYDSVKELRVSELEQISQKTNIKTGKRMGFRFQADNDNIK